MATWLGSVEEVFRALGDDVVKDVTEANDKQIWNWKGRFGRFPAWTYVALQRALNRRGYEAPARLWNMRGKGIDSEAA
jgi:hypothetical protein